MVPSSENVGFEFKPLSSFTDNFFLTTLQPLLLFTIIDSSRFYYYTTQLTYPCFCINNSRDITLFTIVDITSCDRWIRTGCYFNHNSCQTFWKIVVSRGGVFWGGGCWESGLYYMGHGIVRTIMQGFCFWSKRDWLRAGLVMSEGTILLLWDAECQ